MLLPWSEKSWTAVTVARTDWENHNKPSQFYTRSTPGMKWYLLWCATKTQKSFPRSQWCLHILKGSDKYITTEWFYKLRVKIIMMKILLVLLCELALGLLSLEWFFNPFNANQSSLIIDNHAKLLDERFEIPKENRELQHDHVSSARTSHGRNLKQRSSEPQLPRFKFRPFESLARNINFRSPSNVFCKHPIKFAL